MASYLLIVNPMAGGGAGVARAEALRSLLSRDHGVRLEETTGRGSATALARDLGRTVDRVVAVGGDGTLNEVLRGVWASGGSAAERPALGFLAGGTANVATRAFGWAPDPPQLARDLHHLEERAVDVGVAHTDRGERPFLLWCGAGIDAVVIERLNAHRTGRMGIRGLLRHASGVVAAVARYPAPSVSVTVDGEVLAAASGAILANVAPIAFGGTVHPGADPFDGRIDVVAPGPTSGPGLVGLGLRTFTSALSRARGVEHRPGMEIEVRAEGRVPVQLDGEPVGTLPIRVHLVPGSVRLLGVRSPIGPAAG